jgi:hypothetical protein
MAPLTHLTVEFCGVDFLKYLSPILREFSNFRRIFLVPVIPADAGIQILETRVILQNNVTLLSMYSCFKQKQSWQNIWHHFLSHWR